MRRNENEIVKQNNIFIFNKIIYANAFATIIHGRSWPWKTQKIVACGGITKREKKRCVNLSTKKWICKVYQLYNPQDIYDECICARLLMNIERNQWIRCAKCLHITIERKTKMVIDVFIQTVCSWDGSPCDENRGKIDDIIAIFGPINCALYRDKIDQSDEFWRPLPISFCCFL